MCYSNELKLYLVFLIVLLEVAAIELSLVVCYEEFWNAESGGDIMARGFSSASEYVLDWFNLYPL